MVSVPQTQNFVLVVEDDRDIRETLVEILQDEGYRVASAANGRAALEMLRRDGPTNLILLDLMMPVMNGWEFRGEQQQDPTLAQIPIVVLSGDRNVVQKAASLNPAACLDKPIDIDRLLETVARYCR
jgi:CheY-like chemotaxis protein